MTTPRITTARRPKRAERLKVLAVTAVLALAAVVVLGPLYWLVVASGKSQESLFTSSTLVPGPDLSYGDNLAKTLGFQGGQYGLWLVNSAVYSGLSAALGVYCATMAGYLLAWFRFRGRSLLLAVVVASLAIPATALTIPTFVLESSLGLTNSYLGVILPLSVYPLGVFFIYVYAQQAIPAALLDAGRIDGVGEFRLFHSVALRLLMPGMATIFLLSLVGAWNNYFLPLVIVSRGDLFSTTLGLGTWVSQLHDPTVGTPPYGEIFTGSLISILPALIVFPFVQKFVASGISAGSLAGD
ncbi:carbohydrate ABC transporter permease [Sinomonas terrae]|uniref:Carbohydrate ABC transporter permease n=1 Tax=Sinomonas terrae TaxID=2908838 RepID=A0ABS9U6P4_9MICC|nr:carbohydrate ABC transporter permease [Sinomonas terrae]MCH6472371.1 carbohydrate ABC transporter permease [Sinomonas terrae]